MEHSVHCIFLICFEFKDYVGNSLTNMSDMYTQQNFLLSLHQKSYNSAPKSQDFKTVHNAAKNNCGVFFVVTFLADQIQVKKASSVTHTRHIIPYLLHAESWIPHKLDTETFTFSKHLLAHFFLPFSPLVSHSDFLTPILVLQLSPFGSQGWSAHPLSASHPQGSSGCFPTSPLSTHLQMEGFLWAGTFLTHLFYWWWGWAPCASWSQLCPCIRASKGSQGCSWEHFKMQPTNTLRRNCAI